ncbi:hypothetical protein TEHAL1_20400 [Tetragenococcus halophilus]|uniref:hypothetical protein n=1 Tax=Tetragenococcus halophilus TaxID=51669 RepID=UPI000CC259A0|nr:hypothetical protein [Tetragenococcus halophilus]GBD80655.1 hypothetical protein TEHD10_1718 [Tetragenococcus halophilus subsp. halophilus]GFK21219.1 hypothetical protein WJ7_06820 [Tetragenococcus halophilus]GMA06960.1 hypothetical protein GCM10025886_01110 [Tetragenococcus halophilus subsp. flandriensis]GMG64565.1 hypothetical protein TEHAL1_20400 [Tetragenococcus halophilus]
MIEATIRPTVSLIQSALKANKKREEALTQKRSQEQDNDQYSFTRGAAYYGGQSNDE